MQKFFLFLILICGFSGSVFGQTKTEKPRLLAAFSPAGEDFSEALSNIEGSLTDVLESKGTLAVRVCSNDPLPAALATAAGAPFFVTSKLAKEGFSKSDMIYLRQAKNCRSKDNRIVQTEYWAVPQNAPLPAHLEIRRAEDLSNLVLIWNDKLINKEEFEAAASRGPDLTPESYQSALDDLAALLKKNRNSVAVIRIPFYQPKVTAEMKQRIAATRKYLLSKGVAEQRIFIRNISRGIKPDNSFEDQKYPDILMVSES